MLDNNTSTAPLVAVLRPFDGETRFFDPATAKIEAGSLVLDAFTAFPITFQMLGIEGYVRRVYVSAQSEYVPIQIDDLFGGRLVSTIRIQYTEDPAINGWMPIGWVTTVFGPTGDVIATSRGIVEDIRFPKLLEDDEFTLEFPVGTRYFDHDKNQRTFIVGQDGSAREFTPAQVASGATQEDLIEGREPSLNRWTAVRLGAVLLSLIALLIVAVKAFQKRRRSL